MKQHPLSAVFPPMTETEMDELRADIAAHGLRTPIVVYEEEVLDGWHRYLACRETGATARYETFEGDEAAARSFVIAANLTRRHLDPSQRAMIAAKLATRPAHRPGKYANLLTSGMTIKEAADLADVSERSVLSARALLGTGDSEAIAAVERGEMAVSKALRLVRSTPDGADSDTPRPAEQPGNVVPLPVEPSWPLGGPIPAVQSFETRPFVISGPIIVGENKKFVIPSSIIESRTEQFPGIPSSLLESQRNGPFDPLPTVSASYLEMTYDADADVARIQVARGSAARSKEVSSGIVHELDRRGRLLAIEVHKASRTLGRGALANH